MYFWKIISWVIVAATAINLILVSAESEKPGANKQKAEDKFQFAFLEFVGGLLIALGLLI